VHAPQASRTKAPAPRARVRVRAVARRSSANRHSHPKPSIGDGPPGSGRRLKARLRAPRDWTLTRGRRRAKPRYCLRLDASAPTVPPLTPAWDEQRASKVETAALSHERSSLGRLARIGGALPPGRLWRPCGEMRTLATVRGDADARRRTSCGPRSSAAQAARETHASVESSRQSPRAVPVGARPSDGRARMTTTTATEGPPPTDDPQARSSANSRGSGGR
jgi:hypothetical protein